MKIRRTQYVTALWTHATTAYPEEGLSPTDYGWYVNDNLLMPIWFEGPTVPDSLFANDSNNPDEMPVEDGFDLEEETLDGLSDSDGEAWSEESDSEEDDDDY
jgi:hypothetical protein